MTDNQNYYQVLGIDKNASAGQIKAAYRKLAFKYHPDKNGKDPSALKKFNLIAIAYQILINPQKREQYDRTNARRAQKPRNSEPGGFEAIYSSFGSMIIEPEPGTAPPTQGPGPATSQVTLLILIASAVMVSGVFWLMQSLIHHRSTVPVSKIVRGKVPPLPSKATIPSLEQETGRSATLNRSFTANCPSHNNEQTTVMKSQYINTKISNKQKFEPQALRKAAVSSANPPDGVQTAANLQSQPPAPIVQMPAESIAGRSIPDDSKKKGASEPSTQATGSRHTKTKGFTIQVGAYRVKKNAENQMAQLKNRGYAAYIFETRDARKRKWYFVHLNQFENRKNAGAFLYMFKKMEKMSAYVRPLHAAIEELRSQLPRER